MSTEEDLVGGKENKNNYETAEKPFDLTAEIFFAPMSCLKALLAPYNAGESIDKFHQDLSTFVKLKISAFKDKCKKDTLEKVNEQRSRTQKVNPRCLLRRLPAATGAVSGSCRRRRRQARQGRQEGEEGEDR